MIGTYVYFDEGKSRLHLFRRDVAFMPVGTIKDVVEGKATIKLWAPLVLQRLGASSKKGIEVAANITALSRENGVEIKGVAQ